MYIPNIYYLKVNVFEVLTRCTGFQWDAHNSDKNWRKHRAMRLECEQIFFNRPLVVADDAKHSQSEPRFYALGRTDAGRMLFIVFTIRSQSIRVISARDMDRKERKAYHSHGQEDTEI